MSAEQKRLRAKERELEGRFRELEEREAKAKKREDDMAQREEAAAAKESLLAMRAKDAELYRNSTKPLGELINEEKRKITDVWDNPRVPKGKLMKELENVTWANQIKGAYAQALK